MHLGFKSPSEPSLESQLESQPTQKTTSPESVSLEDPLLERQQLESEWVIIEEKDLPGYYENTAEVPSPTSGDLPKEEAAVDSSRVLIDYSVPIDLTKMQQHNERSDWLHLLSDGIPSLIGLVQLQYFVKPSNRPSFMCVAKRPFSSN